MTDLTIIIVSYNTKDLIIDCLQSIYKEKDLSIEIVVIDNASKDSSVKVLRDEWRRNKNLVLIENKKNLGFAKAVNQGIEKSIGEYVLLLNPDTRVKKGAIKRLLTFARKSPDAGVIGAKLRFPDGEVQPSCYNFPTIVNAVKEYWFGIKGSFEKYAPKGRMAMEVNAIVGAAFLISPKALSTVGYLNEKYFMFFEDIDYCKRVWESGLKVYYYPLAEVMHHHGASGKDLADSKNQWRRLIPSSIIYHGTIKHFLLTFILWSGQKFQRLFKTFFDKS